MHIGLDIGHSGLKGVGAERLFLLPAFVRSTAPPAHTLRTETLDRGCVFGLSMWSIRVKYGYWVKTRNAMAGAVTIVCISSKGTHSTPC